MFYHVKRACNIVAHMVAMLDTRSNVELIFIGSSPQSNIALLEIDLL